MTTLNAAALDRIRSHCPCGSPVSLEYQELREGLMDGNGRAKNLIKGFLQSVYFDAGVDRSFCSADCSTRWNEGVTLPYQAHVNG